MNVEIGNTVEGIVIKLFDYGALVRLQGGELGLVHISEIADVYVRDIRDYVKENDVVLVKVLRINDKGRYELSTKQAEPNAVREARPPQPYVAHSAPRGELRSQEHSNLPQSFEERLARFKKESEERLSDLKRNIESKRGRPRK